MFHLFVKYIWLTREILYECPELAFMFVYMYINKDFSNMTLINITGKFKNANFRDVIIII
jgi:hypothetical protein